MSRKIIAVLFSNIYYLIIYYFFKYSVPLVVNSFTVLDINLEGVNILLALYFTEIRIIDMTRV